MKKIWICCLLAVLCLMLPLQAMAEELQTDRACSLTLEYSQDGTPFPGLEISVYRVAEAFADGTFALIAPFDSFPVNIYGITSQREWQDIATTLVAYITAGQVPSLSSACTDEQGFVSWNELPTGLYLVRGAVAENENGTYLFNDFMIYLPTPTETEGFDYDLQAKPKCIGFTPATAYSVVKLWKDAGLEYERPVAVTIDIYKNGVFHESVILNEENQWRYSWTDTELAQWHVVERDVPEGYTVTVTGHETTFTITNINPDEPPPPPSTGDSFPIMPLAMALCLMGFLLVLLGLRGSKYEKKA